jgi:hypothetical protein
MTIADFDPDSGLSEVDQRILRLNHEGLSMKQISLKLREEGIILSKSSVIRHISELRQDPDNDVQVNNECTIPLQVRTESRWYKVIERLKVAIEDYTRVHKNKPSFRTMQYQLIDEKVITDSESDHKIFNEATVKARIGYVDSNDELLFPKLDIDCFADDESRLVDDNYQDHDPTEPTEPGPIPDPEEYINDMILRLKYSVIGYDGKGSPGEDGSIGGRWYDQPEYVEVWEEKNDLFPEFKSILYDKQIKIRSNKGYPSLIFLYKCTEELKELINRTGIEPENIHIKYCGDWDPSGENIEWYIKRRLKQLGIEGIDFQRVVVTLEQIEEYNLPLLSIDKKPDKKKPNPNMQEFVRRYGNKATHLNAFFIERHFDAFKMILRDAVDDHWDEEIYDNMVDEYDVAADDPDEMDEEELLEKRCMMCKTITGSFRPGWPKDVSHPAYEYLDDDGTDEDEDDADSK